MGQPNLGRLEPVELRQAWASEAADFTPWLAQPENIALLGTTIGLDLEVEAQEQKVGSFRADILCKEMASQTWVLIENQLEQTDHSHLGQLITYMAGLEVATVVWIAAKLRDEHRAALDWLNENTSEAFSFFGLEVELWRIGESQIAPKFNIVCQPNDWSRTVGSVAKYSGDAAFSETQQLQLSYWSTFREYMIGQGGKVKPTKAHPQGFMDFSLGRSGIWLTASIRVRDKGITALVVIAGKYGLAHFRLLEADREQYERSFGGPLEWRELPGKKQKHILIRLEDADPEDQADWKRQHAWLHSTLEKLHATFSAAARSLDASEYEDGEEDLQ